MKKLRLESMCGWPAATDLVSARTVSCYSQTSTLKKSPVFLSPGRCRATDVTLSCFSSERTTCWNFNWLGRQLFWKHLFQTLSSKLWKILFFFFSPEKCQFFREFRQNFHQVVDYSVHGYWSTPLVGDISYYFMLQLLKNSHCLACVTLTVMTSEADANPLTPVGQFSLSESHSDTYYCMSQFH